MPQLHLRRLRQLIQTHKKASGFIAAGIVVVAISVGSYALFARNTDSNNNQTIADSSSNNKNDATKDTASPPATKSDETEADPQTQSVAPVQTNPEPPKTTPKPPVPVPPTPSRATGPPVTPFAVTSASLSYFISCSDGKTQFYGNSAYFSSGVNNAGGTITWYIESSEGNNSATMSTTVEPGRMATGTNILPPMYADRDAHDGQTYRIQVTGPNNITSAWYTIPAGKQEECSATRIP